MFDVLSDGSLSVWPRAKLLFIINLAHLIGSCRAIWLVGNQRRLILLQPLRGATVYDLLPEPHQADEGAQRACDHKTAMKTVGQQVLSADGTTEVTPLIQVLTQCVRAPWRTTLIRQGRPFIVLVEAELYDILHNCWVTNKVSVFYGFSLSARSFIVFYPRTPDAN